MLHNAARRIARSSRLFHQISFATLFLAQATAPTLAQAPGPLVWTTSSLTRVGESDAPGPSTSIEIWAARGEHESFQIVVRPPSGSLSDVNVTMSDLTGPGGQQIPRSAFVLYREHYVTVSKASPNWGGVNQPLGAGRYADALIPFLDPETGLPPANATMRAVPFSVKPNVNQPVWVDVQVPRNAGAGAYTASFTVNSDQGQVTGNVTLHVWSFELPITSALKSTFSFGNGASGTLAQNRELLRHRISPISVSPGDERVLMDTRGLTARALGFWSNANQANCGTMDPPPSVSEIAAKMQLHQPDLFLYNYTADEIGSCTALFPRLREWARNLHSAGMNNLVTIAPTPALFDDGAGTGRSVVDIWVVVPWLLDKHAADVVVALAKGDEVWSYNALSQDDYSPKWLMDYPPVNFRIQPGFVNQTQRLTGLLYWKVDRWSADPWNDVNNTGVFAAGNNYPGEGMLVYPGGPAGLVGVAPSMRLKWLRDGVDDYDYIQLLRNLGRGDWAEQVAKQVGPDWTNWTRDPVALEAARRQLGAELDLLDLRPRALSATVTGASAAFSWLPPATGGTPLGYTLLASMTPGGPPVAGLPLWPVTETTINDIPAGRYFVRLTAALPGGTSRESNEVVVNVGSVDVPSAPTLEAAVQDGLLVTLRWSAGAGSSPSHYVLNATNQPGGPSVGSLAVDGPSMTVTAPPGSFYITVTAVNAAGTSSVSNQIHVLVR